MWLKCHIKAVHDKLEDKIKDQSEVKSEGK